MTVQDESSMLVAEVVDPQPGMRVLDCCAAPGGKTTQLAELMNDSGTIVACDLHPHKEKLIRDQADRLGLTSIETVVEDAAKLPERFADGTFDRILLDAPCSGLGVIRRKPDLKWSKSEAEIDEVCAIQRSLLHAVHRLLKPGGILVYSTCTIEHSENAAMIENFLKEHPSFVPEPFPEGLLPKELAEQGDKGMLQLFPDQYGTDGFFIARLRKSS